jgi:hypothetical protein
MFKRICLITAVSLCVLLGSFSVLNLSSNEGRAERVNDGKHEVTGEKIDKKASMSWIEGERNPHSLDAADGDPVDALYVDDHGKIGIGTISPTEKLTVIGTIESTSGGIKFPDGTIQTTASAPTSGWEKVGARSPRDTVSFGYLETSGLQAHVLALRSGSMATQAPTTTARCSSRMGPMLVQAGGRAGPA